MRYSVKIFIGLSMPALALAAMWLWSLSQTKGTRNSEKHVSQLIQQEHELAKEFNIANEKTAVSGTHDESTINNSCLNGVERSENPENVPSSTGSEKEYLSDKSSSASTSECASDEQNSCEIAASGSESFETAPGNEEQGQDEETWEIEFPQALCGRLIGKKGKNVQKISQVTGTKIRLIPQKDDAESSQRLVSLTGMPKQLSSALKALREKFPSVPFKRLNGTTTTCDDSVMEATPQTVHVGLPEQGMFQVFVTHIVDANHFYVQLHDQMQTVQVMLQQLDQQMYQFYGGGAAGQSVATPVFPHAVVTTGMVCVSYSQSGWWRRAQVVGLLMKPDEVEITWLDYGGKETVPISMLRHLRQEFSQLPFQAVECYLSNVIPHQGESSFSMTACALFEGLTQSCILTARVMSYNRECPCLELYVPQCQWTGQPLLINRELVRTGYARWSET